MPSWWPFSIIGSLLLSIIASIIVRRLALRLNIVDHPNNDRKKHDRPTPLLGGTAVYLAFAVVTIVVLSATNHLTSGAIREEHILGLLLGGLLLMIGGALDDRYNLPPRVSIVFPIAAALVAAFVGLGVSKLTNPLGGFIFVAPAASMVLTFFWLMATTYTTKLLDGLDGLATSVSGAACLVIALLALSEKFFQPDVALLALLALAAIIGFLIWNMPPARMFLGEGGSTFLGYLVGVLAIISGAKVATALLVLGIPALDVFVVIIRRLRSGRNPFTSADRQHLHHLLLEKGLSARSVLLLYVGIALAFGAISLILESWQKVVALAILFVLTVIGAWMLARPSQSK